MSRQPIRDARVRVVGKAPLQAFVLTIQSRPIIELVIVSPWLSDDEGGCREFRALVDVANRDGARLTVVTRPPTNASHRRAVEDIQTMRAQVSFNEALHSKILVARMADNSRYAMVGSANLTHGSSRLIETAIILHSSARRRGPDAVDDLINGPVRQALGHSGTKSSWHASGPSLEAVGTDLAHASGNSELSG